MASQRIPLVAGNWKMNFDHLEATYFVQQLAWKLRDIHFDYRHCEIALDAVLHIVTQRAGVGRIRQFEDSLRRTGCFRNIAGRVHWRCVCRYDRPPRLFVCDCRTFRTTKVPSGR